MQHRRKLAALSDRDRGVLELESAWGSGPASLHAKFTQAQRSLGLSPSAYTLILNGLINDPVAADYAPATIARLRHVRASSTAESATPTSIRGG